MSAAGPPLDPAAAAAAQAAAQAAMHQFTVEAFTLLGVGIAVTILRTYARLRGRGIKGLQWDDYLVWVGVIAYAVETGLAYSVGAVAHGLANNGMTDEQRKALSPSDPEYNLRQIGSKIQIAGWSTYSVLLWALKASLLVFYLRLTAGLGRGYRIRINIGFAFLLVSFLIILLNLYLSCRPFHHMWQIFPNPGPQCQPAISNQIVWMYFSMNVSTDIYIITIPMPMLWQANLKPLRKIGLLILFSTGLLVVVCATLRCVFIVTDPVNGAQLAGSWAVRETFIAVVTTNLPMVFPLAKVWLSPLIESLLSFTTQRGTGSKLTDDKFSKGSNIKTFGTGSQSWRRKGPPVNPVTNVTFTESEEHIVVQSNSNGAVKMEDFSSNRDKTGNWGDPSTVGGGATAGDLRGRAETKSIRKQVQVSVTVSDSEESGEGKPRKSMASDHHHSGHHHDNLGIASPGAVHIHHGGSSFAFARGPSRSSSHFGNHM